MRVGNFSVQIPEGRERETGHVLMKPGESYRISLGNHLHTRCDAVVEVDGKTVGSFRITGHSGITLERPPHDNGRFTFFAADTVAAVEAGVNNVATDLRGLIRVTFKPEKYTQPRSLEHQIKTHSVGNWRGGPGGQSVGDMIRGFSDQGQLAAGITGLTGHSNQQFTTVADLEYDESGITIITLRLVADKQSQQVRPLTAAVRANPVPEPLS